MRLPSEFIQNLIHRLSGCDYPPRYRCERSWKSNLALIILLMWAVMSWTLVLWWMFTETTLHRLPTLPHTGKILASDTGYENFDGCEAQKLEESNSYYPPIKIGATIGFKSLIKLSDISDGLMNRTIINQVSSESDQHQWILIAIFLRCFHQCNWLC